MQTILHFYANKNQRESVLALAQVIKKFIQASLNLGLTAKILHKISGGSSASVSEAYILIDADSQSDFIRSWSGTIRWIGKPKIGSIEKEISWFVGCSIWQEYTPLIYNINDVSYQTMRSGGPGGQHVNKVNTAVRAIHELTGIQVSVSDTRSQMKNKTLAIKRLEEKVLEFETRQLVDQILSSTKKPATLLENRPVRTFRGSDFKKEITKNPIKKERQRSKIEIQKKNFYEND